MADISANPLDLVSTDDLVAELARRHTGDGRCLFYSSCLPIEGSISAGEVRTVLICSNAQLAKFCINAGLLYVRERLQ